MTTKSDTPAAVLPRVNPLTSRRDFLRKSALTAVAVGAAGTLAACKTDEMAPAGAAGAADADGCGGGDRRSPKLTLNGVEERDGGPRQAKDRRHGTTGLSTTRGPPTRVIVSRCAYASRGAASVWV